MFSHRVRSIWKLQCQCFSNQDRLRNSRLQGQSYVTTLIWFNRHFLKKKLQFIAPQTPLIDEFCYFSYVDRPPKLWNQYLKKYIYNKSKHLRPIRLHGLFWSSDSGDKKYWPYWVGNSIFQFAIRLDLLSLGEEKNCIYDAFIYCYHHKVVRIVFVFISLGFFSPAFHAS